MQHPIDIRLQNLSCPVNMFVEINGGLIGRTRLTQALRGAYTIDHNLQEKLLTLLDEMAELKASALVSPDWSDAENIREQLAQRRAIKEAIEYDSNNVRKLLGVQE